MQNLIRRWALALAVLFLALFSSCSRWSQSNLDCAPYDFGLPPNVAAPPAPPDVCVTADTVALGRYLFYSKDLSLNQTMSCASCHQQERGFSDGKRRAIGSTGQVHPRNTQPLQNVAYRTSLTWFLPELHRFDNQALIPLFSASTDTTIVELGVAGHEHRVAERMQADPAARALFARAFPDEPTDIIRIARALAAFQTTLLSFRSPYDRGELSAAAERGKDLFFSARAGCADCHSGLNLDYDAGTNRNGFHNVGLYNVGGRGDYPDHRLHGAAAQRQLQGLQAITEKPQDRGRYRTPSLRNVAVTAPYMHDGSVTSLRGAVEHFNAGGRQIGGGAFAGDGRNHPNKDRRVRALGLSEAEKADLIAFLESLSDDCFLSDPRFSDPKLPPPAQKPECGAAVPLR